MKTIDWFVLTQIRDNGHQVYPAMRTQELALAYRYRVKWLWAVSANCSSLGLNGGRRTSDRARRGRHKAFGATVAQWYFARA